MLREQLDQATSANQNLTADIHRLTNDWQRAREELEAKEGEWREEVCVCVCVVYMELYRDSVIVLMHNAKLQAASHCCLYKFCPKHSPIKTDPKPH